MIITFYVVFICLAGLVFQGKLWVKSCSHVFKPELRCRQQLCAAECSTKVRVFLSNRYLVSLPPIRTVKTKSAKSASTIEAAIGAHLLVVLGLETSQIHP